MVQMTPRREENSAGFEVDLAQMTALVCRQVRNVGVRDDASMPPAENELTGAKSSPGEDSFALGSGALHHNVGDHCVRNFIAARDRLQRLTGKKLSPRHLSDALGRGCLAETGVEVAAA